MEPIDDTVHPIVSVVIPARDSSSTITETLNSVLDQDYPNLRDVVVAVPPFDPSTRSAVEAVAKSDRRVRLVDNVSGMTPTGLNAAIEAAEGDVIVRCDAHARLPDGYISHAVATMLETGAVNVGGVQDAQGSSPMQRAIAAAMTSRFGVGDSRFHTGGPAGFVDTVYLGVFRRDAVLAVGAFDESLVRNQDYELNYRLREAGGGVYFDPGLRVAYTPRPSLRLLARQYWDYGRWKRVVIRRYPRSARWRQFAPPVLVLGLVGSLILLTFSQPWMAAIVPVTYLIALVLAVGVSLAKRSDTAMLLLLIVYPTMHLSWGIAFLMPGRPTREPPA